ncbi:hypothetical protein AB0M96_22550, partial [Streptomyces sp. NPDC051098]
PMICNSWSPSPNCSAYEGFSGASFALPAAGGAVMAGAGAGLWAKAWWLGHRESRTETLLWLRSDWTAKGPVGRPVKGFRSTGIAAGDAAPGGARRR